MSFRNEGLLFVASFYSTDLFSITTDEARQLYGIEHLHSVMPRISEIIPFESETVNRVDPKTAHLRYVSLYWVLPEIIDLYTDPIQREIMRKKQVKICWAKKHVRFKKTMKRFKPLLEEETMCRLVRDLYRE